MTSPNIQLAKLSDSENIKKLMLEAVDESPSAFSFTKKEMLSNTEIWWSFYLQSYFDPNKGGFMLYKENSDTKAMCGWQFNTRAKQKHIAYIYWLFVSKDSRNKGLGGQLVDQVLSQIAKKSTISKIGLCVTSTQSSAIKLYESAGFVKIGEHINELFLDSKYLNVCLYEKYI